MIRQQGPSRLFRGECTTSQTNPIPSPNPPKNPKSRKKWIRIIAKALAGSKVCPSQPPKWVRNPLQVTPYTTAQINNSEELKKYLSPLKVVQDYLVNLRSSERECLNTIGEACRDDHVAITLNRAKEMMKKISDFQKYHNGYRHRRNDWAKIEAYVHALRTKLHNLYLRLADAFLFVHSNESPKMLSGTARHRNILERGMAKYCLNVTRDGGHPPKNAMPRVRALVAARNDQEAQDTKLLENLAKALNPDTLSVIHNKAKGQIANKLIKDIHPMKFDMTTRGKALHNAMNGLVKYLINEHNITKLRTSTEHTLLWSETKLLLSWLSTLMVMPNWPLSYAPAKVIGGLSPSSLKRWNELVKRATNVGHKRNNERRAFTSRVTRERPTTAPTPRPFTGRLGTPYQPPSGIFVNTSRRLPVRPQSARP